MSNIKDPSSLPSPSTGAKALQEMDKAIRAVLGMDRNYFGVDYRFHCEASAVAWEVRRVNVEQHLSRLYKIKVEITTDDVPDQPLSLLGKPCSVELQRLEQKSFLHGIVASIEYGGSRRSKPVWRLICEPALSGLATRLGSRVFEKKTVPQVVEEVIGPLLQRYSRTYRFDLQRADYPEREYIVQYQETDLAFIERLLADEGIWYRFELPEQPNGAEELVFADSNEGLPAVKSHEDPIVLNLDVAGGLDEELITSFRAAVAPAAPGFLVRAYDWTNPTTPALAVQPQDGSAPQDELTYLHENALFHGYQKGQKKYEKSDVQDQLRLRLERAAVEQAGYRGRSNVLGFLPGAKLTIKGHPDDLDGMYLVVHVAHAGEYLVDGEKREQGDYINTFTCIPLDTPFRPEPRAKPRITSTQTALVVGPDGKAEIGDNGKGDAIHVDEHGRIQVRFAWDITSPKGVSDPGAQQERVLCWVRCAQSWSGPGWGSQFIPRIGMEVVVTFVDGDPDRPLVIGCAYNGLNAFPYPLPQHKNRSTITTRTNPGGEGSNEIRFDDTRKLEEIYVHAQRDYNEVVENDHSTLVKQNQKNQVDGNQEEAVGADQTLTVMKNRTKTVEGDEVNVVQLTRTTHVSGKETVTLESDRETTISGHVTDTFLADRKYDLTGSETIEVGGDRAEHVVGTYALTTDTEFKLVQGATTLDLAGDHVELQAGSFITLSHGSGKIQIADDGSIKVSTDAGIVLECGQSKIAVMSDKIEVVSTTVHVSGQQGALVLDSGGAELTGLECKIDGSAGTQVTGAIVKLN